jgi:hypothetical protein
MGKEESTYEVCGFSSIGAIFQAVVNACSIDYPFTREPVRRRRPRLQMNRLPTQCQRVHVRAELEACDVWAAQGKRIRV